MLDVFDAFAGAGGSSTGMQMIPGVRVKVAANHNPIAMQIHNANHPWTEHAIVDLHRENPRFFPSTTVGWFSPECTRWSQAQGASESLSPIFGDWNLFDHLDEGLQSKEHDAATQSRLLMFDVLRYIDYHRYRLVFVENVVDIATQAKYATAWAAWRQGLSNLGYEFRVLSINAMHAQAFGMPAPQSRDRIFIAAWPKGEKAPDFDRILRPHAYCGKCDHMVEATQAFKQGKTVGRYRQAYVYIHGECGTIVEPGYLPALTAIDWSLRGERIGDRLEDKTRRRIAAGIARYWGPFQLEGAGNTYDAADPRHRAYGDPDAYYRAWPLTEEMRALHTTMSKALAIPVEGRDGKEAALVADVLRTLTTRAETGIATPFVMDNNHSNRARELVEALPTLTTATTKALIEPFIAELKGGSCDARAITEALSTLLAGGNHHALVSRNNGIEGGDAGRHTTPVTEFLRTLTTTASQSLITPAGGTWNESARSVMEALNTLTTRDAYALLTAYYGNSDSAQSASDPLGTLTTVDRYALVHRNNSGGAEMSTPVTEFLRTLTTGGHQSLIQGPVRGERPKVSEADLRAAEEMVSECYFRMFQPHECAAGMAFPGDYNWQPPDRAKPISKRDLTKAIGNAVCPPNARDLMAVGAESLGLPVPAARPGLMPPSTPAKPREAAGRETITIGPRR